MVLIDGVIDRIHTEGIRQVQNERMHIVKFGEQSTAPNLTMAKPMPMANVGGEMVKIIHEVRELRLRLTDVTHGGKLIQFSGTGHENIVHFPMGDLVAWISPIIGHHVLIRQQHDHEQFVGDIVGVRCLAEPNQRRLPVMDAEIMTRPPVEDDRLGLPHANHHIRCAVRNARIMGSMHSAVMRSPMGMHRGMLRLRGGTHTNQQGRRREAEKLREQMPS